MSRPNVIRPTEVAEAISSALMRYAREIEALLAYPLREPSKELHLRQLMTTFEFDEAVRLLRFVGEMRIRCSSCNRGFSYTRASGEKCIACAQQAKAVREA